ncbi:hypothetical protein [Kordiimonas gwangyangensis]|uniref:hypothetical protein n=2 Tax=Kordiimonas gwangyangensis TaxID=288022 RepID=UPI00036E5121|nr:hypothetical protein [Kordiimonas gwangyangensis]
MLYKSTTALVTAGFLFAASGAAVAGDKVISKIAQLPEKGNVMITATVDDVDSNTEFTIRDDSGETIDVESVTKLTIREGDLVKIVGVMDDELAGIGREIDATSVTVVDAADEMATATGDDETSLDASLDKAVEFASSETEFDTVDALPDEGMVTISGTVEEVDIEDNSFKLRDRSGESIDVHPTKPLTVKAGQKVKVTGVMDDETAGLGIGEQIVSAKVTIMTQG